jgi:RHS repeat-associated protein
MDNPNQKDSLIYMNARYQSPSYGVFLSSDEVTTSLNSSMQDYLHNPQGLSEYKYALNNPVMYWDPDGRIWVGVNGTSFFGTNSNWDAQEFVSSIKSDERFKGQDVGYFNWSGADNEKAREQASYDLATYIDNTMKLYGPNEPLNVFAHSHGYQPVSLYSWSELSYPINNFISIESPNTGLVPNYNKIQNHVHTYSKFDFVQYLGGLNHNVTDVIGAALYASTGGKGLSGVFSLNWGQFGLTSSRNISGALNIDISSYHKNPLEEGLFLGVKNHYIQNSGSTDIYKKEISPKLK